MEGATIESLDNLRQSAESDYRELVFNIARGSHPERATIRETLWGDNKSLADLQGDVERAQGRIELSTQLQEADVLSPEVEAAKTARDEAATKLRVAEEEARRNVGAARVALQEVDGRYTQLVRQERELKNAAKLLADSADPELGQQIADFEDQRSQLGRLVQTGREASRRVAFDEEKIASHRERAQRPHSAFDADADALRREAGEIETKLVPVRERVAAGEAAAAEIAMIDEKVAELRRQQQKPEAMAW